MLGNRTDILAGGGDGIQDLGCLHVGLGSGLTCLWMLGLMQKSMCLHMGDCMGILQCEERVGHAAPLWKAF